MYLSLNNIDEAKNKEKNSIRKSLSCLLFNGFESGENISIQKMFINKQETISGSMTSINLCRIEHSIIVNHIASMDNTDTFPLTYQKKKHIENKKCKNFIICIACGKLKCYNCSSSTNKMANKHFGEYCCDACFKSEFKCSYDKHGEIFKKNLQKCKYFCINCKKMICGSCMSMHGKIEHNGTYKYILLNIMPF